MRRPASGGAGVARRLEGQGAAPHVLGAPGAGERAVPGQAARRPAPEAMRDAFLTLPTGSLPKAAVAARSAALRGRRDRAGAQALAARTGADLRRAGVAGTPAGVRPARRRNGRRTLGRSPRSAAADSARGARP